jgi:hypothetical protein
MYNENKKLATIADLTVVDIVGLDSESPGQSCMQHLCCRHGVKVKYLGPFFGNVRQALME